MFSGDPRGDMIGHDAGKMWGAIIIPPFFVFWIFLLVYLINQEEERLTMAVGYEKLMKLNGN